MVLRQTALVADYTRTGMRAHPQKVWHQQGQNACPCIDLLPAFHHGHECQTVHLRAGLFNTGTILLLACVSSGLM
jgi:hypothetical protein